MRILILGGNGMLGHAALQAFNKKFEVYVTIRGNFSDVEGFGIFDQKRTICGIRVEDFSFFERIISLVKPDVVFNCIGIIKQVKEASDAIKSIEINSLFPHKLASLCGINNCRLIHLSTDCVFSGIKGSYTEDDIPDPLDLYGRTKLLGEIDNGNVLTIRTSIIGRELGVKYGLLEWFLSQADKSVKGYTNAIFSGFTTSVFCAMLIDIIAKHVNLKGIYHISSYPISKFDLLSMIKKDLKLKIEIIPDNKFVCDRSLDSTRFRIETGYCPPPWDDMIKMMSDEIKQGKR